MRFHATMPERGAMKSDLVVVYDMSGDKPDMYVMDSHGHRLEALEITMTNMLSSKVTATVKMEMPVVIVGKQFEEHLEMARKRLDEVSKQALENAYHYQPIRTGAMQMKLEDALTSSGSLTEEEIKHLMDVLFDNETQAYVAMDESGELRVEWQQMSTAPEFATSYIKGVAERHPLFDYIREHPLPNGPYITIITP